MTATPGLSTSELRASIVQALERAVDSLDGGYAALLRDQLRDTEIDVTLYGPAVFCLGLGQLITGSEEKTLPVATALGLLEEMARVFVDLEAEPRAPLVAAWDMPRALNSGDGFYAAAQRVLLNDRGLPDAQRLQALGVFSEGARVFSEALQTWSGGGRDGVAKAARALYPAGASLTAICCSLDSETAARLGAIAEELASQPNATLDGALRKAAALNLRDA
jgi:hypothetical protein